MKEQKPPPGPPSGARPTEAPRAQHGYRNEVNWEGGSGRGDMPSGRPFVSGRQPYGNQGPVETLGSGKEYAEGKRGDRSGRTLQQLEQARRKP